MTRLRLRRSPIAPVLMGIGLAILVGFGSSGSVQAQVLIYTESATASGTIGSTAFTNQLVTITMTADSANVVSTVISGIPFRTLAGTVDIQIAGVGSATFNGSASFGAFSEDVSSVLPGTGATGFANLTTLIGILYNLNSNPNYSLNSPITLSGNAGANSGSYSTTLGNLSITSTTGTGTFTVVSAVPEPSGLVTGGLCVLAAGGVAYRRRRGRPIDAQ